MAIFVVKGGVLYCKIFGHDLFFRVIGNFTSLLESQGKSPYLFD